MNTNQLAHFTLITLLLMISKQIRNGSPEQPNFSENFRDSYRELMPKLLGTNLNVEDFKKSEKARECSDISYLNACKGVNKKKFKENDSSACNHQQCKLGHSPRPHSNMVTLPHIVLLPLLLLLFVILHVLKPDFKTFFYQKRIWFSLRSLAASRYKIQI